MKRSLIILLILFMATGSFAVESGFYGDAFILAGRSSQSTAMGGTGLTSINGISSVISNPAGLIGNRGREIYSQYNNLFGMAFQSSIGYSMPFGKYQVGMIVNTVGVQLYFRDDIINDIPNINDRREYIRDFLATETFYDLENALLFSIARETPIDIKLGWSYDRFTLYLQYGLNAKIIYKTMNSENALGAGFDAGMRLIIPGNEIFYLKYLGDISLGLNIENIIQSPIVWFGARNLDKGNMRVTGGIALHQPMNLLASELIFALDGYVFESEFFPDYGVRYGFQWKILDMIDLRFGKDLNSYTGGVGLKLSIPSGKLKIDYSIISHEINWSHLVSLSYYWGGAE